MHPMLAFGLPNGAEMLLIFLVVLLLFGSKKLPELARGLGKSMHEFRKAKDEFESELHTAKTELTINEPSQRQLAHTPAVAANNAASLEQQVRELQEQLREMNQRNVTATTASTAPVDPVAAAKPVVAAVPVDTSTPVWPPANHPGQAG